MKKNIMEKTGYIMEKTIEKKKNIEKEELFILEKNIEKRMCIYIYMYICMYVYV